MNDELLPMPVMEGQVLFMECEFNGRPVTLKPLTAFWVDGILTWVCI